MAKIMVVEDNEKNMLLLKDILLVRGYDVIEARNGEEAIKMAKEKSPDLIFMDIQMPVMDGFEACRRLKNDPAAKKIKIIGITSYAMKGDREKVLEAGFDDYLAKPINTREIPELVKRYLGE